MMGAETGDLYFEYRGRSHKPRNAGGLQGAGKGRGRDFSLGPLRECSSVDTLISAS